MNPTEHVCHYALLRFMPYREAEELANIGVLLVCPKLGFLGLAVERKKFKRVTDFFPELKSNIALYREGLNVMVREIERLQWQTRSAQQWQQQQMETLARETFLTLTRPREAVFHFSAPRTLLSPDAQTELQQLFERYVERQLTATPDSPEERLRRRLAQWLNQSGLGRIYGEEKIGTADYAVTFPFVAGPDEAPSSQLRAIKPLNLAQNETSEIYNHGDDWIGRIRRLRRLNALPPATLFAVKQPPTGTPTQRAAAEICDELATFTGVSVLNFEAEPRIVEWAREIEA